MKVKSESEVAQSCPTLSHPMDHSLPGSSVHGIFQARVLEWGAIAFSIYPTRQQMRLLAGGGQTWGAGTQLLSPAFSDVPLWEAREANGEETQDLET